MNKPVKAQLGVLSRLIASQPKAPNPTGDSRVLTPENPETKPIIESIVRQTDAKIAAQDAILDQLETHDPTRFAVEEQITGDDKLTRRSEEHTYELQSLIHTSYAEFCLKN